MAHETTIQHVINVMQAFLDNPPDVVGMVESDGVILIGLNFMTNLSPFIDPRHSIRNIVFPTNIASWDVFGPSENEMLARNTSVSPNASITSADTMIFPSETPEHFQLQQTPIIRYNNECICTCNHCDITISDSDDDDVDQDVTQ